MNKQSQNGQSVIEIIVAVSILLIIASTSVMAILGSFTTGRLAEEQTRAALLADEGMEAVLALRDTDWNNLKNGNFGLNNSYGSWIFSGTSDVTGKFTRVVNVSPVFRISGMIASSGGVLDNDTKKITVSVYWDFTPSRNNSLVLTKYLTNWQTGRFNNTNINSCADYCILHSFSDGICRQNFQQCIKYGEIYNSAGDKYCIQGQNANTCCCSQ